jgi:hypothetical protein
MSPFDRSRPRPSWRGPAIAALSLVAVGAAALLDAQSSAPQSRNDAAPPVIGGTGTLIDPRVLVPPVYMQRKSNSATIPYTIAEIANWPNDYEGKIALPWAMQLDRMGLSHDSIRTLVRVRAQQAVQQVDWKRAQGLQADAGIRLLILAGDTAQAESLLARRLAEPGIKVQDSAYILSTAVALFARGSLLTDLRHAERYAQALARLSRHAGYWQAKAHLGLMMGHYKRRQASRVVEEFERILNTMERMDYLTRLNFAFGEFSDVPSLVKMYPAFVDELHNVPGGPARLAAVNARLLSFMVPPPSMVELDSVWRGNDHGYGAAMQHLINKAHRVRKHAPPVVATVWRNVADTGRRSMVVGDGNVHLVLNAPNCRYTPERGFVLARVQRELPEVRIVVLCETFGVWGNVFVSPEEESAALRARLNTAFPTTIPIGVWVNQKQKSRNGGWIPIGSPNDTVYESWQYTFIDRQGRFRPLVFEWSKPGDNDVAILTLLRHLLTEKATAATSNAPPALPATTSPGTVMTTRRSSTPRHSPAVPSSSS